MEGKKLVLTTILLSLLTQTALALNLQSYRFSDSYRYGLLDDALQEKFAGKYLLTTSYGYVHTPFYYSDTYLHEMRDEIIDANHVLTLGLTTYINKNVSVGVDFNAIHNEVFDETYTSLGDTVLKSRINLLRKNAFALSLNPQIILPTGKSENFSTMDSLGGALSIVGEKSFERLHLLASLGALSARDNAYVDVDHRQLLLSQLGVSYDLTEKLNINFETWRNLPLVEDTLQDEGKYFLTGKHKSHPNFSTYFGAGVAGVRDLQRDTYSAFAGIKLHEKAAMVAQPLSTSAAAPIRRESLSDVYFGHDKFELDEQEKEKALSHAQRLMRELSPEERLILEGHASAVGPEAYNMRLSKKRAETIRDLLLAQGVPEEKLTIEWFGENAPQHSNPALNRRVHFKISRMELMP